MMKQLLIVFIGGGMGTVMRFLIGKFLPYSGKGFPWNTFCANLAGLSVNRTTVRLFFEKQC
jgi:CrcB protein